MIHILSAWVTPQRGATDGRLSKYLGSLLTMALSSSSSRTLTNPPTPSHTLWLHTPVLSMSSKSSLVDCHLRLGAHYHCWGPGFVSRSLHVGFMVGLNGVWVGFSRASSVSHCHKFHSIISPHSSHSFYFTSSAPVMVRQVWSACILPIHRPSIKWLLMFWPGPVSDMDHGGLARWRKWRACDVGKTKEGLENELWRGWNNGRVGEWAVT